jgi:hypothetical protein
MLQRQNISETRMFRISFNGNPQVELIIFNPCFELNDSNSETEAVTCTFQ